MGVLRERSLVKAVLEGADLFLRVSDWREALSESLGGIAQAARAEEVYLFEFASLGKEKITGSRRHVRCRSGKEPESFHRLYGELEQGAVATVRFPEADGGFRELSAFPVFVDTRLWGFIGLERVSGIPGLSREESDILKLFADLVASAVLRRRTEDRLEKAVASGDRLFSVLSHDIRGPVAGLRSITEFLRDNYRELPAETVQTSIREIHAASDRLVTLLNGLAEWARLRRGAASAKTGKVRLRDLAEGAGSLYSPVAARKGVRLRVEAPEVPEVLGDQDMIGSVLRNLVANAVKFTRPGGDIRLSLARESKPGHPPRVKVQVEDTGTGIDPGNLKKLFRIDRRFSQAGTAGEEGTGLGLVLCKEFLEKHEAELYVESEVGKGSRFYFYLNQAG